MMRRFISFFSCIAPIAALAGCGDVEPDAGGNLGSGPLLPWTEGNRWTYRVTDADGVVTDKITTIEAEEPVGGTGPNADQVANRVVTRKGAMDETVSWQGRLGDGVVRYREQAFGAMSGLLELEEHWDPHKIHVDGSSEHTAEDASWLEIYQETKLQNGTELTAEVRDRWTVVAVGESIEVPAGTFEAIVLQKVGGSTKVYWYVPGVGKVKEVGGQIEELVEYEVMP